MRTSFQKRFDVALAAAVVALLSLAVQSRAAVWVSHGPYGVSAKNSVAALTVAPSSPSRVYAGTRLDGALSLGEPISLSTGTVFRSVDDGANWSDLKGEPGAAVLSFAVDPSNAANIYAGTAAGVYRSVNGGTTWIGVNTGFVDDMMLPVKEVIQALAIDPFSPTTIYAGTNDAGVYKTTNGIIWIKVSNGLLFLDIRSLAIDPFDTTTVYAGTAAGVYKTTDAGANWATVNNGLSSIDVQALAIHPSSAGTIYAATKGASACSPGSTTPGAYCTMDSDCPMGTCLPPLSVFKTTDSGLNWSLSSNGLTCKDLEDLIINPVTPSELYVAGSNGACKTTDSGANWSAMSDLADIKIVSLAIDRSAPSKLYAGTLGGAGLYLSTNSGSNWSASNNGLYAVTMRPLTQGAGDVYAGSTDDAGVFRTPDGSAWTDISEDGLNLGDRHVFGLGFDVNDTPDELYAATTAGVESYGLGGWFSEGQPGASQPKALAVHPNTAALLFYAGSSLTRSTNGADDWTPALINTPTNSVAIALRDTTYYTYTEGVYRSDDDGVSWSVNNSGLPSGTNLAVAAGDAPMATDPIKVYVGLKNTSDPDPANHKYEVYASDDNGTPPLSWSLASGGFPTTAVIQALAVDPTDADTVWAATFSGVYKTTDGGTSWSAVNGGLSNKHVEGLLVDPSGEGVFAATGAGIFMLDDCGDGILDAGEDCDDGNNTDGDCCSSACDFESSSVVCRPAAGGCDVAESCSGSGGTCPADTTQPNGTPCSDGNACTTSDQCTGGVCGGSPLNCNDSNACTDDSCNGILGCQNANNTASCDDGNGCTTIDQCSGGMCAGSGGPNCDDSNACTDDGCSGGICSHTNNTASCSDSDACTTGDQCSGGSCVPGGPTTCTDGNACTTDTCNPGSGCAFTNNTAACDDGNPCTSSDACSGGNCASGPPTNCGDGNICTTDSCNPGGGGCLHTNNTRSCNDGDYLTCNDTCSGGACAGVPDLGSCLDHFKCYKAKADRSTPFTPVIGVEVDDAFEGSKFFDVKKPAQLCNPVDKNGEGIGDPTAHLECYAIKLTKADPKQVKFEPLNLTTTQQFGADQLAATKVSTLCVPTTVDGTPSALNLDAFKCYKTAPESAFTPQTVSLADQFVPASMCEVKKPVMVCNPAGLDGGAILKPDASLECYKMSEDPKYAGSTVTTDNYFGSASLVVGKAKLLCVPAGVLVTP